MTRAPPGPPLFPYTTLFRSTSNALLGRAQAAVVAVLLALVGGAPLLTGARFEIAPSFLHQIPSRLRPGKLLDAVSAVHQLEDRKSTRLNSSHMSISYAVFCL